MWLNCACVCVAKLCVYARVYVCVCMCLGEGRKGLPPLRSLHDSWAAGRNRSGRIDVGVGSEHRDGFLSLPS